jgi:outer membrane protein
MHIPLKTLAAAALAALSLCPQAWAQHHSLYVGGAYFDIRDRSDPLTGGPSTPTPVNIRVGDSSTLGFGYVYQANERWGVELALGLPPTHKVYGDDFIAPFGQVASVKQLCPTVFLNYHFDELAPSLRPLAGVGINYTRFKSTRSTPSGNAASGGPTTIELTDSWGLAAHGGLSYQLTKQVSLVGLLTWADVQSDMTATTTTTSGTVVRKSHIDFRPIVYSVSVGYRF